MEAFYFSQIHLECPIYWWREKGRTTDRTQGRVGKSPNLHLQSVIPKLLKSQAEFHQLTSIFIEMQTGIKVEPGREAYHLLHIDLAHRPHRPQRPHKPSLNHSWSKSWPNRNPPKTIVHREGCKELLQSHFSLRFRWGLRLSVSPTQSPAAGYKVV